jgi:hypothetical protein
MINRSIQIIILALFVAFPAFAQEPQTKKFRPAGPDAKNPRPDEWIVSFVKSLSKEECDREIDRILSQYDVKLMNGTDTSRPARYPDIWGMHIYASAEKAKQISEDEAILEVVQNAEVQQTGGLQNLLNVLESQGIQVESKPESIEEYRKLLPRANAERGSSNKRPKPGKVKNETERKDKP